MLNAGIIGFGKMGMLHGALLSGSGKAQIEAICDKSLVMRMGFKRMYPSVHPYKDIDKMLRNEKLNIAIISTPTFNHVESAIKAGQHCSAIFIEKPLASNFKDAKRVCKFAQENQIKIQVGFCNRFAPTIAYARELANNGTIGNVQKVEAKMFIGDVFEPHAGWRYKKVLSGGGVLMDFGIHMVDLLVWYFGKIKSVNATAKKLYSLEVEDELTADIQFKNGISGHFETSWSKDEYRKSYSRLEIIGTKGSLCVTDQTVEVFDLNGVKIKDYTNPDLYGGAFMDIGGILYSRQMEAFFNLLAANPSTGCTAEEAVYVQQVIEGMYKSAETGKSMDLEEI